MYPETVKYIKDQISSGFSTEQIREALDESGYEPDVIELLLQEAGAPEGKTRLSGIERLLKKEMVVGVVLLLAVSASFMFFFNPQQTFLSPSEELTVAFAEDTYYISRGGSLTLALDTAVSDPEFPFESLRWFYRGQNCLSIQIEGATATVTSTYEIGCPKTEEVRFEAVNPRGMSAAETLSFRIK